MDRNLSLFEYREHNHGNPGHLRMPNGSLVASSDFEFMTAAAKLVIEAWTR